MTDNYSNYPVSLAERRSDDSGRMQDWTPRDCLIDILRQIDSGKIKGCDALTIVYRSNDGEEVPQVHFTQAGPSGSTIIGMMEVAKYLIMRTIV